MSRRIDALEARRTQLLARCEAERRGLALMAVNLRPLNTLADWGQRGYRLASLPPAKWIAGLASALLLFRSRKLLGWLAWASATVSAASRILRLIRSLQDRA